jgi:plastin-1
MTLYVASTSSFIHHLFQQPGRWRQADPPQARETLKNVNIDSSGRVELEDWVQLHSLLRQAKSQPLCVTNCHALVNVQADLSGSSTTKGGSR